MVKCHNKDWSGKYFPHKTMDRWINLNILKNYNEVIQWML